MYIIPENWKGLTFADRADVTLQDLRDNKEIIDFSPHEYQRFFRADLKWQQNLMVSFFASDNDNPILIPEIALRYHETDDGLFIEVMDGCQRTTTATRFLEGRFELPNNPAISAFELNGNVYNLVGMTFPDIQRKYPAVADWILTKKIHCQIYVNISDLHAAHIFVTVLNNSNELKPQEKRNAIRSFLSSFIRSTARTNAHELFALETNGSDCKYVKISHKEMDVDKMIAELATMMVFGPQSGTGAGQVNKLYDDERFITKFPYKTAIVETLKQALSGINRNPNLKETFTAKVLRNYLYIVSMMHQQSYKIQPDTFMRLYAAAHAELKIVTAEYKKLTGFSKSQYSIRMSGTGGEDTTAAIDMVMEKMMELSNGEEFWTIDPKRCYTKEEVSNMAVVQNNKCGRCGEELDDNPVGAHGYAWADGSMTLTGEGYAAHKYCNLEEGRNAA